MSEPINNLLSPDARRRLSNALMASQFDRSTPQDSAVTERAGMFPFATYANGQTGIAWPGFIAQPVESFVNLLRNGYQGGTGDTQGVEDAFNVAGGALVGGIASPKPANALGIFGGRLAKTADQAALARAENMAARGVPREQIWTDTGWFKGVDGKWRFEIDDSKADFTGAQSGTLGDVMKHPDMFASYPDMQSIDFYVRPGTGGNYSPSIYNRFEDRTIPEAMAIGTEQKSVQPFSVGLHESQHAVQHREGMATGGSPREFTPQDIAAERARIMAIPEDPNSWTIGTAAGDMTDIEVGRSLYRRLAGEVEARAVQKRMDMTPEQRRARFPWLDYDVPEADQIVRFQR